jgi:hypothetical protein
LWDLDRELTLPAADPENNYTISVQGDSLVLSSPEDSLSAAALTIFQDYKIHRNKALSFKIIYRASFELLPFRLEEFEYLSWQRINQGCL